MAGEIGELVSIAERIEVSLTSIAEAITSDGIGGGQGGGGAGSAQPAAAAAAPRSNTTRKKSQLNTLVSSAGFNGVAPSLLMGNIGGSEALGQAIGQGIQTAAKVSDPFSTNLEREQALRLNRFKGISQAFGGDLNQIYENLTGVNEQLVTERGAKGALSALAQNLVYSGIDPSKDSLVGPAKDIIEREQKLTEVRKRAADAIDQAREEMGVKKPSEKKSEMEVVMDSFILGMKDVLGELEKILRPF